MEKLIEREKEEWLLEALIEWEWEREHSYKKRSTADLRKEALQWHSSRLFDCPEWIDFLPFNKRFRPEIYEKDHIVVVINECCGLPGEVTQERIDRDWGNRISCPHCGQWSSYRLAPEIDGGP